jgi:two-component system KDP operon response regulator KdpE
MALILVVDDDVPVRRCVRIALCADGHCVVEAESLLRCLDLCRRRVPDLMIVGADYDGRTWSQAIRFAASWKAKTVIVLRLFAADSETGVERGKDAAPPQLSPFSIGELVTRVRAVLDQDQEQAFHDVLQSGQVRMDFRRHVITKNGQDVRLSRKEYDILLCLAVTHDRVISEQQLLKAVWDVGQSGKKHRLRFYIGQLRRKLEDYSLCPRLLVSEPGVGYRLCVETFGDRGHLTLIGQKR